MDETVLDASAVIAHIKGERGADVVDLLLGNALISAVNLSEVVAKLANDGVEHQEISAILGRRGLTVIPFDDDRAYRAGLLRPLTRAQGLSLGDRACVALAQELGLPAVTADKRWSEVTIDVDIRQIR